MKLLKAKYSLVLALIILAFLCIKNFYRIHQSSSDSQAVPDEAHQKVAVPTPIKSEKPRLAESSVDNKRINVDRLISALPSKVDKIHAKKAQLQVSDTSKPVVATKASNMIGPEAIPFKEFASRSLMTSYDRNYVPRFNPLKDSYNPVVCSTEMVRKLAEPRLNKENFDWCQWALSPSGGGVIVGKSWGKLAKSKKDKERFDALNCNAAGANKNPSCDDSWGDIHIQNWLNTMVPKSEFGCSKGRQSDQTCYRNDNTDVYCVLKNAQINFSRFTKYSRPGTTPSKRFERDFLSTDCNDKQEEPVFPFKYLYSPQLSSQKCDYVHNGTVILYSHDDIRNLGHTLNDVFNVWVMLWLAGVARQSKQLNMLNIDSFKLGHNFDDEPNAFFLSYRKNFNGILKGHDYLGKTLCVQELIIQPIPPRFFIWESWFIDLPCSFIGPSSLYQRWNMHVRDSFGLVKAHDSMETNKVFKILLIVRNEKSNLWGVSRTSRNFLNQPAIEKALQETVEKLSKSYGDVGRFEFIAQDLSKLDFEQQLHLIGSSSIMIGRINDLLSSMCDISLLPL